MIKSYYQGVELSINKTQVLSVASGDIITTKLRDAT